MAEGERLRAYDENEIIFLSAKVLRGSEDQY
jgi:hypothetical protein